MQAICVHQPGGPQVLRLEEVPLPEPGAGEARVKIEAAGLNFIDVYHRTGLYALPLPFTPGQEGAGVVEAVGEGVTEVRPGDRVAYAMHGGSYATHAIVPAWKLVPLPAAIDARTGAALMLQGMTAHYLANSTFPLKEGHRALIHAAAGGVGRLLVRLAKRCGAIVYATVGSREKADIVRGLGADEVILYTEADFQSEIERLTKGDGVDVVYDSVGQATFERSLQCLRPRGMMVSFGQSSGGVAPFDPQVLSKGGSLYLTRPTLAHYTRTRDELIARAGTLFDWVEQGMLDVHIDSTYPLDAAPEAHRRIESRQSSGKILLLP